MRTKDLVHNKKFKTEEEARGYVRKNTDNPFVVNIKVYDTKDGLSTSTVDFEMEVLDEEEKEET